MVGYGGFGGFLPSVKGKIPAKDAPPGFSDFAFSLRLPCCCQNFPERACSWGAHAPAARASPGCDSVTEGRMVFVVKRSFPKIYSLDPPRGRPFGGGGTLRPWGYGGISPHHPIPHHKIRIRLRLDISGKVRIPRLRISKKKQVMS